MALSVVDRAVATGRLVHGGRLVEYTKRLGNGSTVVTLLCDSEMKHQATDLCAASSD